MGEQLTFTVSVDVDSLVERVASRVAEILQPSWPSAKEEITKEERFADDHDQPRPVRKSEVIAKIEETDSQPHIDLAQKKVPEGFRQAEQARLSKIDLRRLKNNLAAVEGAGVAVYAGLPKEQIISRIVDLECILGRTLEEEIERLDGVAKASVAETSEVADDTDLDDEEDVPDDEEVELTPEIARTLDLPTLRALAVEANIDPKRVQGKDVNAVVDLIFGLDEPERQKQRTIEDTEGVKTDLDALAIGELKAIADDLSDYYQYDRNTTREELIQNIFELCG